MSRAYRIRVSESVNRVVRASDHVSTKLEILDILPPEQTAEILGRELESRGYRRTGNAVEKTHNDVTIRIELDSGTVTVRAEAEKQVEVKGTRETLADTDWSATRRAQVEQSLKQQLREELSDRTVTQSSELQKQVTNKLERELGDIRHELDGVVNRVTAEALKQRAAQIGEIKQITEDAASGSLTIVLEV